MIRRNIRKYLFITSLVKSSDLNLLSVFCSLGTGHLLLLSVTLLYLYHISYILFYTNKVS